MSRISLRILHLAQPLAYSKSETDDPSAETLLVFEKEELIEETRASEPNIRDPLPPPKFRGVRSMQADEKASGFLIQSGDYLFAQWRLEDYPDLSEALNDLARQLWWERHRTQGYWMVRKLTEDGRIALQGLIRCADYSRTP